VLFCCIDKCPCAGGGGGGGGYAATSVVRTENEKLIKKLYEEKVILQAKISGSDRRIVKLKEAVDKLRRNEKVNKRRSSTKPDQVVATAPILERIEEVVTSTVPEGTTNTTKLQELTALLGQRLDSAEQQLAQVRDENRRLRHLQRSVNGDGQEKEKTVDLNEDASRLQRELHDSRAKLQLLQTRYDHLEAKARAQNELQQGSYDQLEEYNRRIRELRRALQDVQLDKARAEERASRAGELELEVAELREQNEKFESQIKKLCESPFISSAYDKEERMGRLQQFEASERSQQLKIEHLQETARNHHAALVAMKHECEKLKAEKEGALNQLEELQEKHSDSTQQTELLREKMRLYSGDDGVDMRELEHALTIVKRKTDTVPELSHLLLEPLSDEDAVAGTGGSELATRSKVKELYEANQGLQFEVERAEAMLKAQLAINREMHLELEVGERQKDGERRVLDERVLALESDCAKYEGRVRTLEAERKQRLYDVKNRKSHRGGGLGGVSLTSLAEAGCGGDDDRDGNESTEGGETLLEELGEGEQLGVDENLVEVWVREAQLTDDNTLTAARAWGELDSTPTFALVDFFNFESEATPVLEGRRPNYDFASSYRVVVDDFFLRFLATESLVVEVCKVQGNDFELIGRCAVPLHTLLQSRPYLKLTHEPLLSVRDGSHVGSVNIEVRMCKAVDQLYQLFLDHHPEERLRIDSLMSSRLGMPAAATVHQSSQLAGVGMLTSCRKGSSEFHHYTFTHPPLFCPLHHMTCRASRAPVQTQPSSTTSSRCWYTLPRASRCAKGLVTSRQQRLFIFRSCTSPIRSLVQCLNRMLHSSNTWSDFLFRQTPRCSQFSLGQVECLVPGPAASNLQCSTT
jgi:hypothetical protein